MAREAEHLARLRQHGGRAHIHYESEGNTE